MHESTSYRPGDLGIFNLPGGIFIMEKTFQMTLAGRPLIVETGKLAQFANGSCLIRYGETVILSSATASLSPSD